MKILNCRIQRDPNLINHFLQSVYDTSYLDGEERRDALQELLRIYVMISLEAMRILCKHITAIRFLKMIPLSALHIILRVYLCDCEGKCPTGFMQTIRIYNV